MQKILTFAWKQLQFVYADRGLLLFMLITPVALATIMGLAFGGSGGTITLNEISLAVVNLDEGDGDTRHGDTIANILLSEPAGDATEDTAACSLNTPGTDSNSTDTQAQSLDELLNATALSDPAQARAGVDDGTYAVAVIIPADFSASLAPDTDFGTLGSGEPVSITPTSVEVYGNGGAPLSSQVVKSITEQIAGQITTGSTTINATLRTILSDPLNVVAMTRAEDNDFADFGCAFQPDLNTIQLTRLPLDAVQAQSSFVQIMVAMGSAQAVFFAIFTMNNSLASIYEDKRNWILQRLLVTPTPRLSIIAGKILGSVALVFVQVGLLMLTMTLIASAVMGELLFIWGTDLPRLLVLTFAVGLSVSGLGVFVIGLARTPEQSQIFGSLTALGMAMLGGAFGFRIENFEQLSIIYWGVDGYNKLSAGNADIAQNLLVLLVVGGVLFIIGSWLFNRRVEI
ncbi:MAG: ABC transporter permease [Anaerolineae bacterium]